MASEDRKGPAPGQEVIPEAEAGQIEQIVKIHLSVTT